MAYKFRKAVTLTEAVVAGVILVIGLLGALSYQYHAVKQERMAWAELVAMRTAQMVIEDWKSTGGKILTGSNGYDPEFFDDDFEHQYDSVWEITVDDLPMTITLSSNDVETYTANNVTLRQLDVKVQWRSDYSNGAVDNTSPSIELKSYVNASG